MDHTGRAVLLQLGDLHVGADWIETDPRVTLAATIDAVNALDCVVDAALVLGDLTEHGTASEYRIAGEELARLGCPVHVAMGNHDARGALRAQFRLAGDDAPLRYSAPLGPARLVVLDTTVPGRDPGALDDDSLRWLERDLAGAQESPTILAMHHPPLVTGAPGWDRLALEASAQRALGEVLDRHPQVVQIVGAHLHRPLLARFAGRPLLVGPSTYVQFPPRFRTAALDPGPEAPGFVLHVLGPDGTPTSYVQTVGPVSP